MRTAASSEERPPWPQPAISCASVGPDDRRGPVRIIDMSVAGLPGLQGQRSFWWVMLLILFSGGVTLVAPLRTRPK
jgi:hypothetical protein